MKFTPLIYLIWDEANQINRVNTLLYVEIATLRAAINRLKLLSNHEVLVSEQVANGSSMCIG